MKTKQEQEQIIVNGMNVNPLLRVKGKVGGERGNKESGVKIDHEISLIEYLALCTLSFQKEMERVKDADEKRATSGGAVKDTLYSYGVNQATAEKAGIDLASWTFNLPDWMEAAYPAPKELTEEEKKAAAAKRALTAKQAQWDNAVAPWVKRGMSIEELSHPDLYGPRPQ